MNLCSPDNGSELNGKVGNNAHNSTAFENDVMRGSILNDFECELANAIADLPTRPHANRSGALAVERA